MKIKDVVFLGNANIKGNKKSSTIIALIWLLVISISLISSFAVTLSNAVNEYKEDFRARTLEVDPWNVKLTSNVIENIKQVDHVEKIYMLQGMREQLFDVVSIKNENGTVQEFEQSSIGDNTVTAWSLIGDETSNVIYGETLEESPTFSCIIPSLFYPFDFEGTSPIDLDYIDGKSLIGNTITVTAEEGFELLYNYNRIVGGGNEYLYLPPMEFNLKIVGVYYASPVGTGYYDHIFVSEETGRLIVEQELKAGGVDIDSGTSVVAEWWNTPSLRTHYLLVDDYDNIDYVYNQLTEMGIDCADRPEAGIKGGVMTISSLLTVVGAFLVIATLILSIINLIQSSTDSINSRKGEIGLLKAIGYTDRQIFGCLYYEQLNLTVKGFFMGAIFSFVFILIANIINSHRKFADRLYIVDWSAFLIFLSIALLFVIIIPLICQIITLKKLNKIQPREAMN